MSKPVEMKGDFTLSLPKDRSQKEFYNIGLNDIDDMTYTMAAKMINDGKELEATMFMLDNLCVDGKEHLDGIRGNFVAKKAASAALIELIAPIEVQLKKN